MAGTNPSGASTAVSAPPADHWLRRVRVLIVEGYFPPFYPELDYDAAHLVDVMRRINANTVRFGAVNYYAYYPTDLIRRHPQLGDRDLLRETLDACHREGYRLVAYLPLQHSLPMHTVGDHPEWLQRDLAGKPRTYHHIRLKGSAVLYRICGRGPYRQVIPQIVREVVECYDVDGVYFDAPSAYYQPCYCPHCARSFEAYSGMGLPRIDRLDALDWDDPWIRAYFAWSHDMDVELLDQLAQIIRQTRGVPVLGHGSAVLHTPFKLAHRRLVSYVEGTLFESGTSFLDRLLRVQLTLSTGRVIWAYTGSFNWHPRLWNHQQDYVQEGFASLAAGASATVAEGNRLLFDPRGHEVARTIFDFQEQYQELLLGAQPVKYVALPYSQATGQWYGRHDPEGRYHAGYRAAYVTLSDAKLQTNPVLDTVLDSVDALRQYPAVYLPDCACLSDAEIARLTEYVERGGGLICSGNTSLFNEQGIRRRDFGLGELLGIRLEGEDDAAYDTYVRVAASSEAQDVLPELAPGTLVPSYVRYQLSVRPGAQVVAETVVRTTVEGPAVVVTSRGKGRTVYVNSPLERLYHMEPTGAVRRWPYDRNPDVRSLLAALVRWVAASPPPYRAPLGPGIVPLLAERPAHAEQPALRILHLINMTGPRYEASHTTVEEVTSLRDVPVAIHSGGRTPGRAWLLRSGHGLALQLDNNAGYLTCTVPCLNDYDAVCLELS